MIGSESQGLEIEGKRTALDVLADVAAFQESPPSGDLQRVPSPQVQQSFSVRLGFQPVPVKAAVSLASIVRPVPGYSIANSPTVSRVVMTPMLSSEAVALSRPSRIPTSFGWSQVSPLYPKQAIYQTMPMYLQNMAYVQSRPTLAAEQRLSHPSNIGTARLQHVSPHTRFVSSSALSGVSRPTMLAIDHRGANITMMPKKLKRLSSPPSRFVHVVPNLP